MHGPSIGHFYYSGNFGGVGALTFGEWVYAWATIVANGFATSVDALTTSVDALTTSGDALTISGTF